MSMDVDHDLVEEVFKECGYNGNKWLEKYKKIEEIEGPPEACFKIELDNGEKVELIIQLTATKIEVKNIN